MIFAFIAPFFAVFEVVNILTGYRQKDVDEFEKYIYADIAHYRKQKGLPMVKGYKVKGDDDFRKDS